MRPLARDPGLLGALLAPIVVPTAYDDRDRQQHERAEGEQQRECLLVGVQGAEV